MSAEICEIKYNEPMSAHTSFKIGGRVREMYVPKSLAELRSALEFLSGRGESPPVFGRGTNLLVRGGELDVVAVKTSAVADITAEGAALTAACGATLENLALSARDASLTGLEFAHGIPGTVGGGLYMNAGAYGGSVGGAVSSVEVFQGGNILTFARGECDFSYRHSVFSENNAATSGAKMTILAATFELTHGDRAKITAQIDELYAKRTASQPLGFPSAGSAFRRPPPQNGVPVYAAKLIEDAGLRGYSVGGAQISDKHAGFVVNTGGASFGDVLAVLEHAKKVVLDKFGVALQTEIEIIE